MTLEKSEKHNYSNRLIHEKSPYLLQHAQNPVDWYAWGQTAFDKAIRENKPIFLSIGYSTCHWCHVMEKESFEDPDVARVLNENMVAIKVDREERPDLDHIYMAICQMLTGSGGWPLTVIMTPQKQPFFSATYIPRETRFGRLGMLELIPRISEMWRGRPKEVLDSATDIVHALQKLDQPVAADGMDTAIQAQAYWELVKSYDAVYGGFGDAPKFPTAHTLMFLLRYWKRTGKTEALRMVEKTLQTMRASGIYDQIGHGFHRYATDRQWLVPHFEKMLYDHALLSLVYLETYQATRNAFYARTTAEIFSYVLRDMQAPQGGFYSAEDADSEGREGKFYLWKEEEIRQILDKEEAKRVLQTFQVRKNGNFQESMGKNENENILHWAQDVWGKNSAALDSDPDGRLSSACRKLFEAREKRIHPFKDDKVLTDWNGLMIAALARGSQVLGKKEYGTAARKSMEFIWKNMRGPDGRLLHRYRDGEAGITAVLDDYAFFVWGLLELYEADFAAADLEKALELNETMLSDFWDQKKGGFFFTSHDAEDLLIRKKEVYDGAIPAGNSVALLNLLRLARMTGRTDLMEKAATLVNTLAEPVRRYPAGHTYFLSAYDFAMSPGCELIIVGSGQARDTQEMIGKVRDRFIPNKVILLRDLDQPHPAIDRIIPGLKHFSSIAGKATAYVCHDRSCQKPTNNIQEMMSLLDPSVLTDS